MAPIRRWRGSGLVHMTHVTLILSFATTEEFEQIKKALMSLTGSLLRVAMDMQTQRGAHSFGVKVRRTNSGRLWPRPRRDKVRIDERQLGTTLPFSGFVSCLQLGGVVGYW